MTDSEVSSLKKELENKQKKLEKQIRHAVRRKGLQDKLKLVNAALLQDDTKKHSKVVPSPTKARDNRFCPIRMKNYLKKCKIQEFCLPDEEYLELKKEKTKILLKKVLIQEGLLHIEQDNGIVENVHICRTGDVILVQQRHISVYRLIRNNESKKLWTLRCSENREMNGTFINGLIFERVINGTNAILYCDHYTEFSEQKTSVHLKQYFFFDDNEMKNKIRHEELASFERNLTNITCCGIEDGIYTVGISFWSFEIELSFIWIFAFNYGDEGIMKRVTLTPVRHQLSSLHDLSKFTKNILIGYSEGIVVIWNFLNGQHLKEINLKENASSGSLEISNNLSTCFTMCIEKGLLFTLTGSPNDGHVNLSATNLKTGKTKFLREFYLDTYSKSTSVVIAGDKLLTVTNKSVVCWSIYTATRYQELKLKEGWRPFVIDDRIVLLYGNNGIEVISCRD